MSKRLSVIVNDDINDALVEMSTRRHTTVTETVRRAVSVLKLIEDEVGMKGKRLFLHYTDDDGDDVEQELIFL